MKIGELKLFHDSACGFYVARLCPMNTSNQDPANAFWQQVSKYYHNRRFADAIIRKERMKHANEIIEKQFQLNTNNLKEKGTLV